MARRISVVGTSGSGKTTVARTLAEHYGLPYIELDALHWGPNWEAPPADEFRARVEAALPDDGWVVDGNYHSKVGNLIIRQADLVVWLDLPLATILRRLWSRSWQRIRTQEEIHGGNRETWRGTFFARDSLFVWAYKTHFRRRRWLPAQLEGRDAVRLRSQREVDEWLARHTGERR